MSTSVFPAGGIDSFTNPTATNKTNSPSLSAGQTLQNDALLAIETKVGVDSSAVTTTLDYLVKNSASPINSSITTANSALATGWNSVSGTWTFSSWDSSVNTGVITVPSDATLTYTAGMRVRFTQTTVKYFIVVAVSSTTLTVYGGSSYTLANAAISAISYSVQKVPFGFPANPDIWTQITTNSSDLTQASPTNGTWYNLGSFAIAVGIGSWEIKYSVIGDYQRSATPGEQYITLSTANNTESDSQMTTADHIGSGGASSLEHSWLAMASKHVLLASKTTYYLNSKSGDTVSGIFYLGSTARPSILKAICTYL